MYLEWKDAVKVKPKLRNYNLFNSVEPYVLKYIPKYKRSIFAQIRCGILPLAIETGRFKNVKDPQSNNIRKTFFDLNVCYIMYIEISLSKFVLICF